MPELVKKRLRAASSLLDLPLFAPAQVKWIVGAPPWCRRIMSARLGKRAALELTFRSVCTCGQAALARHLLMAKKMVPRDGIE
jgi:hypothetical protein